MTTERTTVGTRPMPELLDGRADAISHMPTLRNLEDCLRRAAKMVRQLIGVDS